jgi:hypothetical protein
MTRDSALDAPVTSAARARTHLEQRIDTRFDKLFPILVGSEIFGDATAVARNISRGGMLVEMGQPLPLGTVVSVHFRVQREDGTVDELVARAEVKHHHILNFGAGGHAAATRASGLRFLDFDDRPALDVLPSARLLH